MRSLMKGARTAVRECMNVKMGEDVLILTDTEVRRRIPQALFKAAEEVGATVVMKTMTPLERNGQEPPAEIARLMRTPDILFIPTSKSLTHTNARRRASKAGVRIASMPGIREFSFIRGGLTADYKEVQKLCNIMFKRLKGTKEVRVTSRKGTEITMEIGKYTISIDDGIYHKRGSFGNLPAGEVDTAPIEGTANGTLFVDSPGYFGKNIRIDVEDGFAKNIHGSPKLKTIIRALGKNAGNIAEVGIGTNKKAKVIGCVLEDEKVFGTVHIAFGSNTTWGGKIDVPFHADVIIEKPTLIADGKVLIKDGKWLII